MNRLRPTVATIDLDAVRHNVRTLAAAARGAQLCAVVKANAYGHGAVPVARACREAGASHLAVSSVEEALELREAGIEGPILLFSEPPVAAIDAMLEAEAIPPLYTEAFARAVAAVGVARGRDVPVHLCFDTGMGRVGVEEGRWPAFIDAVCPLVGAGLAVVGTWTHLARADERDAAGLATTEQQLARFDRLLERLADHGEHGLDPGLVHAANSAGTLLHDRARGDAVGMVRAGIAVYGLSPADEVDAADHDLRPALSLTTEVAFAKHVTVGTPISYGHRWTAPSDGWVATLPIGYADGVPRLLTNRFEVLWRGERHPIVGTVTMDMLHLWCGDAQPDVGDEVVLLGTQGGEQLRVEDWAATIGTITYEVTCQLTPRVPREYSGGAGRA